MGSGVGSLHDARQDNHRPAALCRVRAVAPSGVSGYAANRATQAGNAVVHSSERLCRGLPVALRRGFSEVAACPTWLHIRRMPSARQQLRHKDCKRGRAQQDSETIRRHGAQFCTEGQLPLARGCKVCRTGDIPSGAAQVHNAVLQGCGAQKVQSHGNGMGLHPSARRQTILGM